MLRSTGRWLRTSRGGWTVGRASVRLQNLAVAVGLSWTWALM
jgi:hypothetical protein